jgi:hypothetical protein
MQVRIISAREATGNGERGTSADSIKMNPVR